jgi:hypothetical protein
MIYIVLIDDCHEMLHGYQFESRKISIRQDNAGYGSLYDLGDETAGCNRELLVAQTVFEYRGPTRINSWTQQFGASMAPPAYQTLSRGSIEWVWSFMTGLKKEYKIYKNLKGTALIQYNWFNRYYKAPYVDRLNSRIGFEYMLKKVKRRKGKTK